MTDLNSLKINSETQLNDLKTDANFRLDESCVPSLAHQQNQLRPLFSLHLLLHDSDSFDCGSLALDGRSLLDGRLRRPLANQDPLVPFLQPLLTVRICLLLGLHDCLNHRLRRLHWWHEGRVPFHNFYRIYRGYRVRCAYVPR